MSERVAKLAEDEPVPQIERLVYLNLSEEKAPNRDPFAKTGEEIKSIQNISPNFKRKVTNEIKKFHQSADGQVQSKRIDENEIVDGYDAFGVVSPPHSLEGLADLYDTSPIHFAAINAKVANIVGLGYKLVETPKTKRALEEITDETKAKRVRKRIDLSREELEEAIENLNEEESFTEILIKVWRDYESMGNGYIEVGRRRDGTIGYLGHIPAQTMRIRKERDGYVQISSNKAQFFRNFGDSKNRNPINSENDKPNEVIHIKKYSPNGGGYYGVPDIVAAIDSVAGMKLAAGFNLDYFKNKAVPRHLITLKGANLGQQAQTELLSFFETGLKGQNHRSLFVPLPSDEPNNKVEFAIEAIEANIQDASFEKYDKSNTNKILTVHRTPITKVSVGEGVNLALARDADKTFKEQVCQPEQRILEKKVNRIVKELTDAFLMKLNEMTLTDADTQSKIDERMVKAGIWVPNEPRLRDGMPALKGADERVDLNAKDKIAQQAAEATAQRERDSERSANSPDTSGEARQPKGEGRATG